ncbi:MAG: cytochrome c oxidase assembly protein, partial [Nitriliruptorales bacterium]
MAVARCPGGGWRAAGRAWGGPGVGLGWLVVALLSPLEALGGTLFSAHMLQHVALTFLAPPLLVAGRAGLVCACGLPEP